MTPAPEITETITTAATTEQIFPYIALESLNQDNLERLEPLACLMCGQPTALVFTPDDTQLIVGYYSGFIVAYSLPDLQRTHTFVGHQGRINSLAVNPDGTTLASASSDTTLRLWDISSGELKHSLELNDPVWSIAFSPDGNTLASALSHVALRLWDANTGDSVGNLRHFNNLWSVAYSSDGSMIATGASDNKLHLWDTSRNQEVYNQSYGYYVRSVGFSSDDRYIVSSTLAGVRIFDRENEELVNAQMLQDTGTWTLAFSPRDNIFATATLDNTVHLWDASTGNLAGTLEHNDRVWSVAFSTDGNLLATGSSDGAVRLWNMESQEPLNTVRSNPLPYYSVNIGETNDNGSSWDNETGEIHYMDYQNHSVSVVTYSPDGHILANVSHGAVGLWDSQTGNSIHSLEHYTIIFSVAFNPDGNTIATGSQDGTILIWGVPAE